VEPDVSRLTGPREVGTVRLKLEPDNLKHQLERLNRILAKNPSGSTRSQPANPIRTLPFARSSATWSTDLNCKRRGLAPPRQLATCYDSSERSHEPLGARKNRGTQNGFSIISPNTTRTIASSTSASAAPQEHQGLPPARASAGRPAWPRRGLPVGERAGAPARSG
jgi:hypothetical protein